VSRLQVYTDPLQHAALATAVVAPLVPLAGPRIVVTAITAATVIDVDHAVAAKSVRIAATTGLETRPRSHNLLTAVGFGAVATAVGGPLHGWAAFGGLASHLLHDAGDRAAPTPVLWPFRPARQLGRRWQLCGTTLLVLTSLAIAAGVSVSGRSGAARAGSRTA
jgi:LexA-binding, inner membrane-associated putative hydrolase